MVGSVPLEIWDLSPINVHITFLHLMNNLFKGSLGGLGWILGYIGYSGGGVSGEIAPYFIRIVCRVGFDANFEIVVGERIQIF